MTDKITAADAATSTLTEIKRIQGEMATLQDQLKTVADGLLTDILQQIVDLSKVAEVYTNNGGDLTAAFNSDAMKPTLDRLGLQPKSSGTKRGPRAKAVKTTSTSSSPKFNPDTDSAKSIIAALPSFDESKGMKKEDLVKKLEGKVGVGTINMALGQLVKLGRIHKIKHGIFCKVK